MRNGYTLVELLIVIAISAMLSTMIVVYSRVGQNQVSVTVESAKIDSYILEVKNLAIATYGNDPKTCGYGAYFNIAANRYSLFAFQPPLVGGVCPTVSSTRAAAFSSSTEMNEYSGSVWNIAPAGGVRLMDGGNGDNLVVALFIPPAPTALMSRDGSTFLPATVATPSSVYLVSTDGGSSSTISMNSAGQVSL